MCEQFEQKDCENCKYGNLDPCEEPCVNCCNNLAVQPIYNKAPLLWEVEVSDNPVSHPSHYNQGNIECIDAMVAAFGKEATATFCHINAFKYLWRTEHKNGLQDIDKAIWYLNKYKELKSS